ncbi:MAG: glycosyltransferase family 39 protein [Hyphomonadaceae bacterium]|nr:glycosyltransferase family 39 protein [Hyphomonadaceae bacterium]
MVLIALALASAAPGLTRIPVLDRDEARYAQATRQMLETGDFIEIRVQNEARNKKPIGIYWMQAAAVAATESVAGGLDAIWAYRLPSVFGAILAVLATFWGGIALVGRRAAFLGACLLAPVLLLSTEAMTAKTDAMLCGLIALAMAALARLRERMNAGRGLALVFWVALGLGALVKGPVAPMVVTLATGVLLIWERAPSGVHARWMRPLFHWTGPALAALIVLPWFIAIEIITAGGFAHDAFFGDISPKVATAAEGHGGLPGYHLALLALSFFPATIGLVPGLALAWDGLRTPGRDGAQAGIRFLIAWALPTWLVFEFVGTKLPHYVLPVFPALALLAGAGLVVADERRWRVTPMLSVLLFAVGAAAFVGLIAYVSMFLPGDAAGAHARMILVASIGAAVALGALLALLMFRSAPARAAIAIGLALVATWTLRDGILPQARTLFVSAEAAGALERANLLERAPLVIGFLETSLVFETRTDARLMPIGEPAFVALQSAPAGTPVLMDCDVAAFAQLRDWSFRAIGPDIEGLNYANGDHVCLRPGIAGEMTDEERARFLEGASRGAPERRLNAPVPQQEGE